MNQYGTDSEIGVTQVGNGNRTQIDQIAGTSNGLVAVSQTGTSNTSKLVQGGRNNYTTLVQTGSLNDATIEQYGNSNRAATSKAFEDANVRVVQLGDGLSAKVYQDEKTSNNIATINQKGGAAKAKSNSAEILQSGGTSNSTAAINQEGRGLVALIQQFGKGGNNKASIDQSPFEGYKTSESNSAAITQDVESSGNTASVTQRGRGNGKINSAGKITSYVNQFGTNSKATLTQLGDENSAGIIQSGDNNTATIGQTGNQNGALDANGNPTTYIVQSGNSNLGEIYQTGNQNVATVFQAGNLHKAYIDQKGDGNIAHSYQSNVSYSGGTSNTQFAVGSYTPTTFTAAGISAR